MLRLRLLRIQRGLTIAQVAAAASINRVTLGFIERGRLNPTTAEAQALSAFYGFAAADLFDQVNDTLAPNPAAQASALVGASEER